MWAALLRFLLYDPSSRNLTAGWMLTDSSGCFNNFGVYKFAAFVFKARKRYWGELFDEAPLALVSCYWCLVKYLDSKTLQETLV